MFCDLQITKRDALWSMTNICIGSEKIGSINAWLVLKSDTYGMMYAQVGEICEHETVIYDKDVLHHME